MTGRDVCVIGSGQTPFGELWDRSYRDLLTEVGLAAVRDADIDGSDIDAVFVGSMSTGKLLGQEHVAPLLLDGAGLGDMHVPATRVEAAGASGGVAFRQAVAAIQSGQADVAVVGGIEKMSDVSEADQAAIAAAGIDQEWEHFMGATDAALHAIIAKHHMAEYGTRREDLAAVAVKNHRHALANDLAHFRREIKEAAVLAAPMVADPLGVLDCAPQSDGAACVVLAAEDVAQDLGRAVRVSGSGQASDALGIAERPSLVSNRATVLAGERAFAEAGVSAADIDVAEVHDAYTIQELLAIEDLGLVKRGDAGKATREGRTTYGGDLVVNPSGGLKAMGHPAGASGIAQVHELVQQLRGQAGKRQVDGARIGVAHNLGGTGATATVHVLEPAWEAGP